MSNTITPQQRMAIFNQSTRQNIHMLPIETITGESRTAKILLPKSRLLSKIGILVNAKVTSKHASQTSVKVNPAKILQNISLDLNNGFSPFVVSGEALQIYNRAGMKNYAYRYFTKDELNLTTSAGGTENDIEMFFELPVTLNDRDPIGLILLQSAETNVTCSLSTGVGGDIIAPSVETPEGYTVTIGEVKVTPVTTTFSIPAVAEGFPDLSAIKLVNSVSHSFLGTGTNTIKLSTGTIYRKLLMKFEDENGKPLTPEDFTSDIKLIFNQADNNYSISAKMLQTLNGIAYNELLPEGVYALDFSDNGFPNYSGTRDYIDSELLTELWLQFGTNKRGKAVIISECIARVR